MAIIKKCEEIDSRIRIISRENRGIIYSLNEAIFLANGEYIARMDADDIAYIKLDLRNKWIILQSMVMMLLELI